MDGPPCAPGRPTLIKFDFTNLKMPEGNVEPLISPKLAVAMESNTHIEHLLMGCTNLQDQEAAILAVSLRSNSSLKVLNIDTNAIQPLTLESIAKGTSVNQALQELRCNNTCTGRLVTEAFLHALKSNPMMCKLGYPVTDAYFRGEIDKQLTRNNDAARKRRLEEKRRREAAAEAGEDVAAAPAPVKTGYPKVKASPKKWPPEEVPAKADVPAEPEKIFQAEKPEASEQSKEKAATDVIPEVPVEASPMLGGESPPVESPPVEPPPVPEETPTENPLAPEATDSSPESLPAAQTSDAGGKAIEQLAEAVELDVEPSKSKMIVEDTEPAATMGAPAQTLESFLRGPELGPLPGMVDAMGAGPVIKPEQMRGYLYKKSPSARLMKSWDWRFFVIQDRRLLWWRRDHDVPSPSELTQEDPSGCKGFINFAKSSARVVPHEKNPAIFVLEAIDGAWKDGSLKDMTDAQRTFEFDCTDSAHSRDDWMRALSALQ